MPTETIRIVSDIHYGDRASRVRRLGQLRPLLDGVGHLVLNGDTLDTRPGPSPAFTAECRAEVLEFFHREIPAATFLTGNHDADFSPHHRLDLAGGEVFVIHGDIFFDDIVPWSRDAPHIARLVAEELGRLPVAARDDLDHRLAVIRRVAAAIPQRHQSERNPLKHALYFIADTIWPPLRTLRVIRAWQLAPKRADELVRLHRPTARFLLAGHTHKPGLWRTSSGVHLINTGSFCPPLGAFAVDLEPGRVMVRAVETRGGEFRTGEVIAQFPLAAR